MSTCRDSRRMNRQQGMAMVVVLVFLLALTAISLYGARQAVFGERIARNALDAQVAQQAAEAALRDAEADLKMPEGRSPNGAFCLRDGQRPIKDKIGLIVAGASCLSGICKLQDAQYAALNAATAQAATSPDEAPTGAPWWRAEMGGRWNNDLSTKPQSVGDQCSTFVGGVPLGTFTGTHQIPGIARQPEYLIEYMGIRNASALFRVTARGFGYDAQTQAMVQSYVLLAD